MTKPPAPVRPIKFRAVRPKPLAETPGPIAPPVDVPTRRVVLPPSTGRLSHYFKGLFVYARGTLWGAVQDLLPLSHGTGCGAFVNGDVSPHAERTEGIDSFATLHLTTDLNADDVRGGSDLKLAKAIDEANELFPLQKGICVFAEDLAGLLDKDFHGTARLKSVDLQKPVIPLLSEAYRTSFFGLVRDTSIGLKSLTDHYAASPAPDNPYSVVLYCNRPGSHVIWEVRRLLIKMGLTVEAQFSIGASVAELSRMPRAKLGICFSRGPIEEPTPENRHPYAEEFRKRNHTPYLFACFINPERTAASLRTIASHFDDTIKSNAESLIAQEQADIDPIIEHYRARLKGALIFDFANTPRSELEPFQLLGIRIGNANGWPSKSGIWRIPRKNCDFPMPTEEQMLALFAEAKPDAMIRSPWDALQAKKRGFLMLEAPFLYEQERPGYWGYAGFVHFAAHLDRELSRPWRKLIKPPWKDGGG